MANTVSRDEREELKALAGHGYMTVEEYAVYNRYTTKQIAKFVSTDRIKLGNGIDAIKRLAGCVFIHKDGIIQPNKNKGNKMYAMWVVLVVIFISAPNAMAQTTNSSFTGSVTPSGITLKGPILNHSGRPLIFKEKHPVFWKTTYPFRKFVWHPLKMASDKTKFTKLAVLTSDLTIKFGEVAAPYQPALSAGTTLLQAGTTAGVFIKGK